MSRALSALSSAVSWSVVRRVLWLLAALCILPASAAMAKDRHALIIGVGEYSDTNGINRLVAPANDADEMRFGLESKSIGFVVDVLKDADVPNKDAFKSALDKFLGRVESEDDVLVYFSGHGINVPGKGNYFLLADAKSEPAFLIDYLKKNPLEAKNLDTLDKKKKRYEEWIAEVALSETNIEK